MQNSTAGFRRGIVAILATLILSASPLFAQTEEIELVPPTKGTAIQATGSGRVRRTPDYVDVTVGVSTIGSTAGEAQAAADAIMAATNTALLGMKLAGAELETGWVDLSPRYDFNTDGRQTNKIIGYTATITVRVRTTDLKTPSKIIDTALKAGCNRIDGVRFGIKDALAAREEAIKMATRAAKRKAEVMADAMDLKITTVAKVRSSSQQGGWWANNAMSNTVRTESTGDEDDATAFQPGKAEVTAEVTATFTAEPVSK